MQIPLQLRAMPHKVLERVQPRDAQTPRPLSSVDSSLSNLQQRVQVSHFVFRHLSSVYSSNQSDRKTLVTGSEFTKLLMLILNIF